jgi:hypothetical protein
MIDRASVRGGHDIHTVRRKRNHQMGKLGSGRLVNDRVHPHRRMSLKVHQNPYRYPYIPVPLVPPFDMAYPRMA